MTGKLFWNVWKFRRTPRRTEFVSPLVTQIQDAACACAGQSLQKSRGRGFPSRHQTRQTLFFSHKKREGCSKPRCPELMCVLRDLEYVEQSGFGINKIIEVYGKDVFKITENFITVVLPFDKSVISSVTTTTETTTETTTVTTTETVEKLLNILAAEPNIKAKDLCGRLDITIDGVRYHLNK